MFTNICSLHEQMYVVLDALDEFNDRRTLFPVLKEAVKSGVKMFATSRDLPDIRDALHNDRHVEIKANHEDLKIYVEDRLSDSDFSGSAGTSRIVEVIVDHVGGM